MSRQDVIRRIVERESQKKGLAEEVVVKEAKELHAAACEQFGTWETALRYAGINVRCVRPKNDYTPQRVKCELRKLCLHGYNLTAKRNERRDRRLYEAAREHFGTWRRALQAAGINVTHARLNSKPRQRNEQKIIAALQQRRESGLSLRWVNVCLENRAFATAAKNTFRSWRRALIAAGIPPELQPSAGQLTWNKQRVIDCIKDLHEDDRLTAYDRVRKDHSALVAAARRHFGSWGKALVAAGVAPEQGDQRSDQQ